MTQLFDALAAGDADAVAALLAGDRAVADARHDSGLSAVMFALYHRQPDLAQALREAGASVTPFEAAALGEVDTVARALDAGEVGVSDPAPDGFTLLHLAAFFGHAALVRDLLGRGAPVNAEAPGPGLRPLHSAAAARSAQIVAALLAAGADPNAAQRGGFTALHSAALHGDAAMARALLEHGADPALAADDGRDAAAMAREGAHHGVLALLASG